MVLSSCVSRASGGEWLKECTELACVGRAMRGRGSGGPVCRGGIDCFWGGPHLKYLILGMEWSTNGVWAWIFGRVVGRQQELARSGTGRVSGLGVPRCEGGYLLNTGSYGGGCYGGMSC